MFILDTLNDVEKYIKKKRNSYNRTYGPYLLIFFLCIFVLLI